MEPDFQRALLIVLVIGFLIAGIGGGALFLAFRSFGRKSSLGIIAGVVAFIFACCLALFFLSRS